jgi:hypothetical protein
MNIEFLIGNASGNKVYKPIVQEGIEWTTERRGSPGTLKFNIIKDDVIRFNEGDAVRLKINKHPIFYGFVFQKKRNKDQIISVTAYDQLRYFQNKDTYVYTNKTASQFIRMLAADYNLQTGTIENTGFVISSRVEDNTSLFDMIGNALDLTLQNSKEMYVLYDNFGKITLKNISNMRVGSNGVYLMIDASTGENFDYTSSIDSDTYNKIKLTYENDETGKRDVYIAQSSANINNWGILQYFDTLSKGENGQAKANALLKLYNAKTRKLKITNAIGNLGVRAGSMIVVNLALGDITLKNFMLVEKCVHKFKLDEHFMDLTLRGGEFVA